MESKGQGGRRDLETVCVQEEVGLHGCAFEKMTRFMREAEFPSVWSQYIASDVVSCRPRPSILLECKPMYAYVQARSSLIINDHQVVPFVCFPAYLPFRTFILSFRPSTLLPSFSSSLLHPQTCISGLFFLDRHFPPTPASALAPEISTIRGFV